MSYATASQLLLWFGARELAEIAVPDDHAPITAELLRLSIEGASRAHYAEQACATADLALLRIESALAEGSRLLDSYLATRYPLPLLASVIEVSPLPRACTVIALALLYDNQLPKAVEKRHQQVIRWLTELAAGRVELAPALAQSGRVANGPHYSAGSRVFDEDTLQEFIG